MFFLVSLPFDARPACLENGRQKPGNKAELYCGQCRRDRCLFRSTMTPTEYKVWQLRTVRGPLPVGDVSVFILQVLADFGEATTEQLFGLVGLSRSHFWKRLNALREKGIVVSRKAGRGRELVWRLKGMDILEPLWVQELFFGDFEIVEPVIEMSPVCWTKGSPFDEVLVGEPVWGWEV